MRWHLFAACAAIIPTPLISVAANAQAAANADCWYPDELSSARVDNFQIMLMVGALKCRNQYPDVLESYEAFIKSKQDVIAANQYVVQAHFIRQFGTTGGIAAFRNYETGVGNFQSRTHSLDNCDTVRALTRLAARANEADLTELTRVVADNALATACPAEQVAVAAPATAAIAAPAAAGAAALASAAPDTAPAVTAPTVAPAAAAASAPAPVATANASSDAAPAPTPAPAAVAAPDATPAPASVAAPPTPSAAQALQDAARALSLAANALASQSAPAKAANAQATNAN